MHLEVFGSIRPIQPLLQFIEPLARLACTLVPITKYCLIVSYLVLKYLLFDNRNTLWSEDIHTSGLTYGIFVNLLRIKHTINRLLMAYNNNIATAPGCKTNRL